MAFIREEYLDSMSLAGLRYMNDTVSRQNAIGRDTFRSTAATFQSIAQRLEAVYGLAALYSTITCKTSSFVYAGGDISYQICESQKIMLPEL